MATYTELYSLNNKSALKNRVTVACMIAAEAIMAELVSTDNHANRLLWAKAVFANRKAKAEPMFWAVLAANADLDVEAIENALDPAIQTNVDAHIDLFADGS